MAKSRIVGSRELKTRLGHYLSRVRRGETILVTDRHEPVAELRPLTGGGDEVTSALRKLAAAGAITLPVRRKPLARFAPIVARGATGSAAVLADRAERG
jgi:prevent-host-death family protein